MLDELVCYADVTVIVGDDEIGLFLDQHRRLVQVGNVHSIGKFFSGAAPRQDLIILCVRVRVERSPFAAISVIYVSSH